MSKTTTRDIAQAAGVSQSTVSFVLNGKENMAISSETRAKVLATAEEMDYHKKSVKLKASREIVIGLMIPTLSNLYYPFLTQNVQMYAKAKGISIIIMNTMRDSEYERYSLGYLQKHHVDGILYAFSPKIPVETNLPMVIVSEKLPDVNFDNISLNSVTAGYKMADHLSSLGHTRIAYISSPFNNITSARKNRLEGIRNRLAELGSEKYLTAFIDQNEIEELDAAYEFTVGQRMTEKLLGQKTDVTAIIAVNDMTAAGAMSVLHEHNIRIPEQIAICGFDNLLISRIMYPQLTTIDQLAFHGCKLGLDILLDKITNRPAHEYPIRVEYEPQLIVRGSTQPAKAVNGL